MRRERARRSPSSDANVDVDRSALPRRLDVEGSYRNDIVVCVDPRAALPLGHRRQHVPPRRSSSKRIARHGGGDTVRRPRPDDKRVSLPYTAGSSIRAPRPPLPDPRLDRQRSPMVLYDLTRDREPQARPVPRLLRREKRLEHPRRRLRADPFPVVGHHERHPLPLPPHVEADEPARMAGVAGIEQQVHERLLEQSRFTRDPRKPARHVRPQRHAVRLGEAMLHQIHRRRAQSSAGST